MSKKEIVASVSSKKATWMARATSEARASSARKPKTGQPRSEETDLQRQFPESAPEFDQPNIVIPAPLQSFPNRLTLTHHKPFLRVLARRRRGGGGESCILRPSSGRRPHLERPFDQHHRLFESELEINRELEPFQQGDHARMRPERLQPREGRREGFEAGEEEGREAVVLHDRKMSSSSACGKGTDSTPR